VNRGLRICLAASGGGHLRQLVDLEPVWSKFDSFFVTEKTALGESVANAHRAYFVTHVAIGQARLGRPVLMIRSGWRNFFEARRAIARERPDVVITTGAGTVFFAVLWGWLFGAKIIAIESFARFDRPSIFMRITSLFAHRKVVQSEKLAGWRSDAEVFDPLKTVDKPRPLKERLLFATVGATLPFDRMIDAVAELKRAGELPERVIAQVGIGGTRPSGIDTVETLTFDEMKATLEQADLVVCHGGTGSLITALRAQCRIVAMPRLFSRGEVYDQHQEEIVQAFVERGLICKAYDVGELRQALQDVRKREPMCATTDPQALRDWLTQTLAGWGHGKRASAQ
jgi:UDP-N-acetylglucosamine--N-acetylmuramyl-(pentapeptide) pyrophosphoryl-undecaprenol N-acetylglucosamine transferase